MNLCNIGTTSLVTDTCILISLFARVISSIEQPRTEQQQNRILQVSNLRLRHQ